VSEAQLICQILHETSKYVPPRKHLRNLGPPVAHRHVRLENRTIFFQSPSVLADIGIKMIVPAFATLLSNASRQVGSNQGPLFGSKFLNKFHNLDIFFGRPGSLDKRGLENLLPSMKALYFGSIGKTFGYQLPVLGSIFFDCRTKRIVLCKRSKFESCEHFDTIHRSETMVLTSSVVHLTPVDFLTYGGLTWPIPLDTTIPLLLGVGLDDVFLFGFWFCG
jgi:hypothetical protein